VIRAFVVSLLVLVVVASGCDDAEPGARQPDQRAIRAGLAALYAGDHATVEDRRDGRCFAGQLVVRATPQQLRDGGVLDADWGVVAELPELSAQLAGLWVDAQFACADFVEASARAQLQASHGTIDARVYADCLRDLLSPELLRAAVVGTLTGDWNGADVTRLGKAQQTCAGRAA
jgi:hypothetical protein